MALIQLGISAGRVTGAIGWPMRAGFCLALVGLIAGCVAPATPVVRGAAPVATPSPSRVGFEDAPLPNRKLVPTSDSIIRLGH